jgi:hypothetical protein
MPRFNQSEMIANLNDFDILTQKIRSFLDNNHETNDSSISQLNEMYGLRRKKLENIGEWLQSSNGKEFMKGNKEYWDNFVKKIFEIDQKNIKDIKICVDNLNIELKKLMNNKNVLIYTKEIKS